MNAIKIFFILFSFPITNRRREELCWLNKKYLQQQNPPKFQYLFLRMN